MKTELELKQFYNIEYGKTYKILKSICDDFCNIVGKTFHLERALTNRHGDMVCRFENGARWAICNLDDYTYEEVNSVSLLLTPKEKDYLSNVIKPFEDRVVSITKVATVSGRSEFIKILVQSDMTEVPYEYFETISLPNFKTQTMYKNLESCKRYTLKELGL